MTNTIMGVLRLLRTALRVTWLILWISLIAPWVVLSAIRNTVDRLRRLVWLIRAVPRAASDTLPCPRGHASGLLGVFECRGCGGLYAGHAFQRCPICGSNAGHIMCEHCGLTIQNPMV